MDLNYFETILLYNALFNDTYLAGIIDHLKAQVFHDKDNGVIASVLSEFYVKRGVLPNATELKLHLTPEQRESYKIVLNKFKDIDKNYNPEELYTNTETFLKERSVLNAIKQVANDKDINAPDILKLFEDACNISLIDDLGRDYLYEIDKHIQDLHAHDIRISSGYKWLDEMLGGGFLTEGRSLYVFSGVTNSGKSIILGNIGVNIMAQNKPVIIISLEMSEIVYSQRISGQLTRIPLKMLKEESESLKKNLNKFRTDYMNSRLFIKEFPPKSITVNHIKAYINKLIAKKKIKPAAIIVDYINLISATNPTGKSYEDIKSVAEQLRAISYIYKCPVITATQLNRAAFDSANPGIETTGESMGLPMTADFQAVIWSDDSDKELGITHLGVQKNRFGLNYGTCAYKIDYNTLAISELDGEFETGDTNSTFNIDSESIAGLLK
jgi:archaellum biogenesis ATPase FlaH